MFQFVNKPGATGQRVVSVLIQWGIPAFALIAMGMLWLLNGNATMFLMINHGLHPLGDGFWINMTVLGDAAITIIFILPFIGRRPDVVWQFFLALLFALLWTQSMKVPFSILRPPGVLPPDSFYVIGPRYTQHSFPSGHTTTIFVWAGVMLMQQFSNRLKAAFLLLAVMVGLSRIACGVHWPMDVLGGMLGGWLSALAGVALGRRYSKAGQNIQVQRVIALVCMILGILLIFWYDNGHTGTRWLQTTLAIILVVYSLPKLMAMFTVRPRTGETA